MESSDIGKDSETASIDDKYLSTVRIEHRDYQRYAIENQIWFSPVDEEEAERLLIQDSVFEAVFDGRLIFPPIHAPSKILDCGYGSASWAVEVAEQYPECEVTGVDISPYLKPEETPENLWLQLDDLNRPFTFESNSFDVVHSRLLACGINKNRWPSYLRDIFRVLKPGGWVQMVEIYYNIQSDNGTINEDHALRQWSEKFMSSLGDLRNLHISLQLDQKLTAAGFQGLQKRMVPLPLCGWSSAPRDREIGNRNKENVSQLLYSQALYPFTERLGMSMQELLVLVAHARHEAADVTLKPYFPLFVPQPRRSTDEQLSANLVQSGVI